MCVIWLKMQLMIGQITFYTYDDCMDIPCLSILI